MARLQKGPATPASGPLRPPAPGPPPSRGAQRFLDSLKRWAVPIIGGITPVALIVINISVWINDHIQDIRIWVAIAAFVSGMMFNSWIGLNVYRWVQRRWPAWSPVTEHNQEVMLVIGMGVITLVTFLTSLGLYLGLRDATALPNAWTLWYGIIQIGYPFVLKAFVDRDRARRPDPGQGPAAPQAGWPPAARIGVPPSDDAYSGGHAVRTGYGAHPQQPMGSPPLGPPRQPPPPGGGYLPPS